MAFLLFSAYNSAHVQKIRGDACACPTMIELENYRLYPRASFLSTPTNLNVEPKLSAKTRATRTIPFLMAKKWRAFSARDNHNQHPRWLWLAEIWPTAANLFVR
jgi:hypothetical protein